MVLCLLRRTAYVAWVLNIYVCRSVRAGHSSAGEKLDEAASLPAESAEEELQGTTSWGGQRNATTPLPLQNFRTREGAHGYVRLSRMHEASWAWVTDSGTSYEHSFKYDPYLKSARNALWEYCNESGDGSSSSAPAAASKAAMCNDEEGVKRILDVATPKADTASVMSYVENYLKSASLGYLKQADSVSAEFVMFEKVEIESMLELESCRQVAYLRHGRPSCVTPVDPFLKSIGTCPLSALEREGTFDVVPFNFTCSPDDVRVGAAVDSRVWRRAGNALVKKGHYDHAVAAFYMSLKSALLLKEENSQAMAEAINNLGASLAASNDLAGMTLCYKTLLLQGFGAPSVNMATLIKLILYVPPMFLGGAEEMKLFRQNWLQDAAEFATLLRMREKREPGASGSTFNPDEVFWWRMVDTIADPIGNIGQTLFHLAHQGENDFEMMEAMDLVYRLSVRELSKPTVSSLSTHPSKPNAKVGKVRVGFVSTLLSDHSIGRMMVPITTSLASSPYNDEFEVVVIGSKYPTYSQTLQRKFPSKYPLQASGGETSLAAVAEGIDDAVISHTCKTITEAVDLPHDLDEASEILENLDLDVLIFPDIGMDALTYFLARRRYASVQLAWWGHPITTGLRGSFDYYFGLDVEEDSAGSNQYAEQLVRMEHMNTAPFASYPEGPERTDELRYFGIERPKGCSGEEEPHIYMVLGRLFKIHHEFEEMVFKILQEDECGVVVLISEKLRAWNSASFDRIAGHHAKLRNAGILDVDVLERVRYVAYWNYVRIMAHATIVLDTYPYGGCLTAQEAMSNGKVVVTLPSKFIRGRFTMAIYEQMGKSNAEGGWPIANSKDEYVSIAVKVARNEGGYRDSVKKDMERAWQEESVHKVQQVVTEWASTIKKSVEMITS